MTLFSLRSYARVVITREAIKEKGAGSARPIIPLAVSSGGGL